MGPALLPVGEELRQGRIVHQIQHIVLRRDVAVGDARGVIDAGIVPTGEALTINRLSSTTSHGKLS